MQGQNRIVFIDKDELREMILSVVQGVLENRKVNSLPSGWLTKRKVAQYLGVSVATIDVWRKKGLPEHRPNGEPMFYVPEVDEWMRSDKK